MTVTQRKILLAIDGSDQSLDAVHYASKVLPPQNVEVVLFHVMRNIDDAFWTMGINPGICKRVINIRVIRVFDGYVFCGFRNSSKTELEIFPNLAAWRKSPSGLTRTNHLNSYHLSKHRLVGTPPATGQNMRGNVADADTQLTPRNSRGHRG